MQLKQAIGNTWYLEDWQLIPLYKTSPTTCVLLDTGFQSQRSMIEKTLAANGLEIAGILGSHIHIDHSSNHRYFQQKYRIPVALSAGEAGIAVTRLNLKAYNFYMLHPQQLTSQEELDAMLVMADETIYPDENHISFCGADFEILHTPGHTPDHISVATPDGVLYMGDAILTGNSIRKAKLPYNFSLAEALDSMRKVRETRYNGYIAAHRGVHEGSEVESICDECIAITEGCAQSILETVEGTMSMSDIVLAVCRKFEMLSRKERKAAFYERNVYVNVSYLVEQGQLENVIEDGVERYRRI